MRIIPFLATAFLLALPRLALADPTYPAEIQSHLGLTYTPPCTLCHSTNAGGLGTVVTLFGESMRAEGLTTDISTLDPALDALGKAPAVDSNDDGVPDIQQLKDGFDPSTGASLKVQQEQFGCGAHIAQRGADSSGQALVVLGLVSLVLGRRARPLIARFHRSVRRFGSAASRLRRR